MSAARPLFQRLLPLVALAASATLLAAPAAAPAASAPAAAAAASSPEAAASQRKAIARKVRAATRRTARQGATAARTGFEVGVNAHPRSDLRAISRLGARAVRMEFDIGTPVAEMRDSMGKLADNGARAVLLAGFHKRIPSAAQARSVREWADEFGPGGRFWADRGPGFEVREIEFGNETSYSHQYGDNWDDASYAARARTIGRRARTAALAIRGTGVGLLVQGEDGGTGSSVWMDNMLAAAPSLPSLAAGWTVHPYGPRWQDKMDRLVKQAAAAGAPALPMYITEWGVTSDGGRCLSDNYGWDRCMSFEEAGSAMTTSVAGMRDRYGSRLRMVLLYQAADQRGARQTSDREHYFGLLRTDARGEKGAMTRAAQDLIRG